jgi:signal transduction histidine kinase
MGSWRREHRRRARSDVALLVGGAALCAMAVLLTIAGSASGSPWLEASARAAAAGVPIAVGVHVRRLPDCRRFGDLLAGLGAAWAISALAASSDAWLHALGRMSGWLATLVLVLLVLSFPSGRPTSPTDRVLASAIAALVALLYLPTVLVVERFPEPSPWATCNAGCPDNALTLTGTEPAVIDAIVVPLREALLVLLFAVVAVRLAARFARASRLERISAGPFLLVGCALFASFDLGVLARRIDADGELVAVAQWTWPLAGPLLAWAYLLGRARWRVFIATANQRLTERLGAHPEPGDVREALAFAFADPALLIVSQPDGGGRAEPAPGRWVTEVHEGEHVVARIHHDAALRDDPGFVGAARAYVVLTLENHRLGAETVRLLDEVRDSRARIQASADEVRRRVERDLHDGAQQRLVALRIRLELAAERIDGDAGQTSSLLRELGAEVETALDEVRSLARGIYPSTLADRGLVEALRSVALRTPLPTTVLAETVPQRLPRVVETTAYFCCLEAMQNALKHARGARGLEVQLSADDALRFEVRDDGEGFDEDRVAPGAGLTNMRDRVGAVNGTLSIHSSPAGGTRVAGAIPLGRAGRPPA